MKESFAFSAGLGVCLQGLGPADDAVIVVELVLEKVQEFLGNVRASNGLDQLVRELLVDVISWEVRKGQMKLGTDANGILGNRLRILLSHSSERLKMFARVNSIKLSDHRRGKVVKVSPETVINSFTGANEFLGRQRYKGTDLEDFLSVTKGG